MRTRIRHMLIKEFTQSLRDPRMRAVIFVLPVVQLVIFGYAVNRDLRHVATVVCDLDQSTLSRELVSHFVNSGYFDVAEYADRPAQARALLDRSRAAVILQIDPGFENDLRAGRTVPVQLVVDGTDSATAGVVLDYSAKIASQFSTDMLFERMSRQIGLFRAPGRVDVQTRAWFNENLESRNYYVPGVICIIVTLVALLLTSMAVVREKEIGTIEQIIVTPITPLEFVLGKTLPFALLSFIDVILVTTVGVLWFDVPIRGSLVLLFCAAGLYLLTSLGVGLVISTISRTQQQAMMSSFLFYMPAMLLSGFMFPIANMPVIVQWLTYANPLRYFLVIVRGIFLKGVGVDVLWPQLLALALIGVLTLGLAVRRFRKTLT